MSCPTNCVSASWPWTWLTRNWSLMCILLKSPVRSWTVTSVTRPTSLSGVSVGVSPRTCLLNISGARRLYQTFAFHLSLILRAAARDFFSAMRIARRCGAYLKDSRVGEWILPSPLLHERNRRHPLRALSLKVIRTDMCPWREAEAVPARSYSFRCSWESLLPHRFKRHRQRVHFTRRRGIWPSWPHPFPWGGHLTFQIHRPVLRP